MDQNKLNILKKLGYSIPKTCGFCEYSAIDPHVDWGTCLRESYSHLKHSGPKRQLSVHRCGICDNFKVNKVKAATLGKFLEFMK